MGGETSAVTNPYDPAVVGLMLGMKLPDGSEKTISFQGRKPPLGIDFIRKAPLTVKCVKAGSHGEALGLQPGWIVTSVNGDSVVTKDAALILDMVTQALHAS